MKSVSRFSLLAALAASFTVAAHSADKVAQESGAWNTIVWSPAGTPATNDLIHIENGLSVIYSTGTSPNFNRLYVGDNTTGTGAGTLEVSGGILGVNSNAAGGIVAGRSANSTGTINVTGGTLRGTGASATGIQLGLAANSLGTLNVSAGAVTLTGSIILGAADTATGNMTVSGGTVTTSTGTGNANLFVGGRLAGTTTGNFTQTGGTVNINNNNSYFAVGYSGAANQTTVATARIVGGTFNGNVRIGRQDTITSGGGTGKLTIGAAANVSGRNQAWEVSGTGTLAFELGNTTAFNAVDLSLVSVSNAIVFSQAGAQIQVDGTNLAFAAGSGPITLINYGTKGPDDASKANVAFSYLGFAGGYNPMLAWKDTGLLLYLYGLPTYSNWVGGTGTWSNATSPASWFNSTGTESGGWNSQVATFAGTAGTVTVDDASGPVVFTGLTFKTTGYAITGDDLNTSTAASVVTTDDAVSATISSAIAGTGGIEKTGLGTLVLTGANTYTGATTVAQGTLQIDGAQTAATGAVTVGAAGTLAGAGTTGGAVTVQNGGTLVGQSGQVFTMAGLTLNASSNLNVTLGAPSANRLFQVNGNLTLDGLLNVTNSGGFGPGVYRLIDYTGALTNNGLTVNSAPVGLSDLTIQTSVANQVNLVFQSITQNFWGGGDGVWTADAGSTAWENFDGSTQGAWQPQFAIFQAAPGIVTVDTTAGDVVFTGAQFANDGYTIAGGALTTNTVTTTMRVGDGSAAGEAMTGTISSAITGTGGLEKTDLGTLVLTGANTYAGGTTVTDGTLQLGNGGTTGSVAGGITNNATLAFNRSDAATVANVISGTGRVEQKGSGTLVLTGENTYTGGTTVTTGTLQLGNGGTTGSIAGDVVNNATFAVNRSDTFTFAGAISGSGAFNQVGSGTTVLTGANTSTGVTTISSGALQIGNGGTTGSISGNIANNAALVANRSNAFSIGGVISGAGTFTQAGGGVTTLSGANTYSGATTVSAGTLLINGNQSAATGAVTVASGATLGGTGQTGGIVTVQNGGTLSGQTSQTFTMGGLTLGATANLNVSLGAPGTTALFQVNGNLVLDGVLNVSNAGAFGEGLYRLINYTGSLTDNGLTFGSLPTNVAQSALMLQTSVANQVNLLYSDTTSPLPIWTGGSGVWSVDPAQANWGNAGGTQSGGWRPGMAILAGQGGTVTVNTAAGLIVITGIQFASDGYVVTGGALTNNTAGAAFRVGDGTAAGAAMTATIASSIIGTGGVNKTDLGTLILTGNNTYSGGTTVTAGVLQISSDANLGAAAGGLTFAGGTLRAGASFTSGRAVALTGSGNTIDTQADNVTLNGALSGTGSLTKRGDGLLTLSGNNTNTGATVIAAGGIFLNNSSLAATTVNANTSLAGNGTIRGNLTNNGTVSPGASPGTITVTGNYTQGATGVYNVEISPTAFDRLLVTGTASLNGTLRVSAIDGYTPRAGQSYKIIEAGTRTGTFSSVTSAAQLPVMLLFTTIYNPTDVTLQFTQRAFASLAGTNNQIRAGAAVDGIIARGASGALINTLNSFMTEDQVLASLSQLSPSIYARWFEQAVYSNSATMRSAENRLGSTLAQPRGLWMELVRRDTTFDAARENPDAEGETDGIIVGGDLPVRDDLRVGALFSYNGDKLDLDRQGGSTDTDRFSLAAYARYDFSNTFLEGVAGGAVTSHDSRRTVAIPGYLRTAESSVNGRETFASLRFGRPIKFSGLEVTPYLGGRYVNWTTDDFSETGADDANLRVHQQSESSLAVRLGLAASLPFTIKSVTLTPRVDVAAQQELGDKTAGTITADLGGSAFTVTGRRPKDQGYLASVGVDVDWKSRLSGYLRFAGEWQTAADEGLETRAGVEFRF